MRRRLQGIRKLASLLEYVSSPRLLRLRANGVPKGHYLDLARPWLARLPIRSILDVGANTGQFALAAHEVFPDATIHSFEPLPDCHDKLSRRLAAVPGASAHRLAIGESAGTLLMHRSSYSPSSSVLPMADAHKEAFPFTRDTVEVEVEVARLDDVCADLTLADDLLLKIDVQGYEDRVLRGAAATLRRARLLIIETSFEVLYEGQPTHETVCEMVGEAGFEYHGALGQLLDPGTGRVLSADSVFERRSSG